MHERQDEGLTERRGGLAVVGRKHLIQRLRGDSRDHRWEGVRIVRHESLGPDILEIHRRWLLLLLLRRRRRSHGERRLELLDEVGREGRVSVVNGVG